MGIDLGGLGNLDSQLGILREMYAGRDSAMARIEAMFHPEKAGSVQPSTGMPTFGGPDQLFSQGGAFGNLDQLLGDRGLGAFTPSFYKDAGGTSSLSGAFGGAEDLNHLGNQLGILKDMYSARDDAFDRVDRMYHPERYADGKGGGAPLTAEQVTAKARAGMAELMNSDKVQSNDNTSAQVGIINDMMSARDDSMERVDRLYHPEKYANGKGGPPPISAAEAEARARAGMAAMGNDPKVKGDDNTNFQVGIVNQMQTARDEAWERVDRIYHPERFAPGNSGNTPAAQNSASANHNTDVGFFLTKAGEMFNQLATSLGLSSNLYRPIGN